MNKVDEYVDFIVNDFLEEKQLLTNGKLNKELITIDILKELAKQFLEIVYVDDKSFIGIEGWLLWIDSCLLQKWMNIARKYEGPISDNKELIELNKEIEEFESFTEKYLKFKKNNENGYQLITDE